MLHVFGMLRIGGGQKQPEYVHADNLPGGEGSLQIACCQAFVHSCSQATPAMGRKALDPCLHECPTTSFHAGVAVDGGVGFPPQCRHF